MKHTITLSALDLDITYSVKDDSPRGCHTVPGSMLEIGDKIVIDNYFTEIVPENDTQTAQKEEEQTMKTPAENAFPKLRAAYIAEREQQRNETSFYIVNGYMLSWAEEHRTDSDKGIKAHATAYTWEQYQRGEIDRHTATDRALKRYWKQETKERAAGLAALDRIAKAPDVVNIDIRVEWKRSAAWGYNPTATADIRTEWTPATDYPTFAYETHTGTASGCGYDKRSAAVAEALNRSDSAKKLLYAAAENVLASGAYPSKMGLASGCVTWRDSIGYGSGYSILPYFEGGVGVSCFWAILEKCGFKTHSNERRKHTDYYSIFKMEE